MVSNEHEETFKKWVDSAKSEREDFPLRARELLRTTHSGHHVTRVNSRRVDLFAYAKAGFATAVVDNQTDHSFDALRTYNPSEKPFENREGTLYDDYSFCRWLYVWRDISFILYSMTERSWDDRKVDHIFLLASTEGKSIHGGHHPDTDLLLLTVGNWSSVPHNEIYVFDNSTWTKDAKLWKTVQTASWDDVILEPGMKDGLIQDVTDFFDSREIYQSLNLPFKRGIILHGIPGNGKTASIKALIKTLNARDIPIPSLYVKAFDSCRGQKWSIQAIFTQARIMAPCLLIFEDLDSLVDDKLRSYFLNEVDGLENNDGILMIGSTNHLSRLDPAIAKRPSRFDRKYHFKLPDEATRTTYARYWKQKLADKPSARDFTDDICPLVAQMTEGFSFAYLGELFMSSLLALIRGVEVQEDENSSGGTSTPPVVVEKPDMVAEGGGGTVGTEKGNRKGDQESEIKPPRVFPSVEIPDHLAENLLLKIIHAQARLLFGQMGDGEDNNQNGKLHVGARRQPSSRGNMIVRACC